MKGLLGEVLVDACQEGQRLREGRGGRREGGREGEATVKVSLGRFLLMLVRRVSV